MAASAQAEKPKTETNWFVQDTLFPKDKQTDKNFKRTHEIDGINYTFSFGEKKPVPVRHAMKFAQVSGFLVWDQDRKKVEPLRPLSNAGAVGSLKPHETIATYAELSTDALVARCRRIPNGSAFHAKSPRPAMIDFLMSGGMPPLTQTVDGDDDLDATEGNGADGDDTLETDGDEDGDANLADGIFEQTKA